MRVKGRRFHVPWGASMATRKSLLGTGVACALLLVAGAAPASAEPRGPHCGQVVRGDVTLTADVTGCSGDGLVVGATGVTINLNHHRLSGRDVAGSTGVRDKGYSDLRIVGGRIEHFDVGVSMQGADRLVMADSQLDNLPSMGVLLVDSADGLVVRTSASRAAQTGIQLASVTGYTFFGNALSHNGDGIVLYASSHNLLVHNTSSDSGAGITLVHHSNHNAIVGNVTDREQDTGVLLDDHADDNLILENRAEGSAFAGIAVGASDRNQVRDNRTNNNLGSGIAIVDSASDTRVSGNQADRNGTSPPGCVPDCPLLDDGIHVDAASTTLTANRASKNADLGIDAVAGVRDGGRNVARDNGDPRQCVNVTCHGR